MAQWGRNNHSVTANSSTTAESSNGSPMGVFTRVKGSGGGTNPVSMDSKAHFGNTSSGSRANVDYNLYGNTTVGAFINNIAVGVFSVNSTQINVTGGGIDIGIVTSGGSGYQANAAVTLTVTNGGSSATANATSGTTGTNAGRITALNANQAGTGYITAPTVAIAAPAAITIVANTTGVVAATDLLKITSANSYWQVNDRLFYAVAAGNTAIGGLTSNTFYYVSFANTTGIAVSATPGGANIDLTEARVGAAETGHTIKGDTATGYFDVSTVYPTVTHSGWVLRTEGTGGRAGRVSYETLVAMGSMGQNTSSSTGVAGNPDTVVANTQYDPYV
jgi:hypothetical protein